MNVRQSRWSAIVAVCLLPLAAWAGVAAARIRVLPRFPPPGSAFSPGSAAVPSDREFAGYASENDRALRTFLFALENGIRQTQPIEDGTILRVTPGVRLRVLREDADMIRVRFEEGAMSGRELWMKAEALESREHSQTKTSRGGVTQTCRD